MLRNTCDIPSTHWETNLQRACVQCFKRSLRLWSAKPLISFLSNTCRWMEIDSTTHQTVHLNGAILPIALGEQTGILQPLHSCPATIKTSQWITLFCFFFHWLPVCRLRETYDDRMLWKLFLHLDLIWIHLAITQINYQHDADSWLQRRF